MKTLITIGLLTCSLVNLAQTKIEKVIPVQAGQKLEIDFEYPELIKIQTWDKKEILIKGEVSINRGENDNAFELQVKTENNVIAVTSVLKNQENIPQRVIIKKGDVEYYFKTKDHNDPEVRKFIEEHGNEYTYMSNGIVKEITLEIFIPKGMESNIKAKYGLVEVKNFDAPLRVDARYGGVDATITARSTGELTARTRHGEILTNLDIKFESNPIDKGHNQWTEIHAKPGSGPKYAIESKYGKVYLRKPD